MGLPADSHVHSEWSWDAPLASMERSCVRAIEIGLPAIAFTEHVDHTAWLVAVDGPYADAHLTAVAAADGLLTPPTFDATGYLAAIERCRDRFPQLRILNGLELGEPHWHAAACANVLAAGSIGYSAPCTAYPTATASPSRGASIRTATPRRWSDTTWPRSSMWWPAAKWPSAIAHGFKQAASMAEAHGFRPGINPYDLWPRVD